MGEGHLFGRKKSNLDGPDGLDCYWYEFCGEDDMFLAKQKGGDFLMIWGFISFYGSGVLVHIDSNLNSTKYIRILNDNLLEFAALKFGENWSFQQDNASIHTSYQTMTWLKEKGEETISCPAESTDLNIIQNVRGLLALRYTKMASLYTRRAKRPRTSILLFCSASQWEALQYNNIDEMASTINLEWGNLDDDYIKNLYRSITSRLISVLERKWATTKF